MSFSLSTCIKLSMSIFLNVSACIILINCVLWMDRDFDMLHMVLWLDLCIKQVIEFYIKSKIESDRAASSQLPICWWVFFSLLHIKSSLPVYCFSDNYLGLWSISFSSFLKWPEPCSPTSISWYFQQRHSRFNSPPLTVIIKNKNKKLLF